MFWTQANHLHFDDNLRGDPLPTIAALHNLIEKQGYPDVVLDFAKTTRAFPEFVLPIVTACRAYRQKKIDFDIRLPTDRRVASLFVKSNWAHLIAPERFEIATAAGTNHLAATQFLTAEEHYSAVDSSIGLMLQLMPGVDRNRIKALEWALNEITDNVLNHANSPIGGIMQVMTYPKLRRVEFYVSDAGLTIPRTLRQGRPEIHDDTTALRRAIEEGVTRNSETNQGNGLFGTFKCCEVSGGEFDVISGCVSLSHRPGQLQVRRGNIPLGGTFVRAAIRYDFERLLETALVFKGRPHEPSYDFVERIYQKDGDEILFKIAAELNAFGSREAGRMARTKIENLMENGTAVICFDFEDIRLISSSFADEVFGKLFVNLGPLAFGRLCQFRNVDSTVRGLIDRAIGQRMRI